jgi:hypothetical protein
MKRHVLIGMLALVTAIPLTAQTPKGWKLRIDHSTNASDPDAAGSIKFTQAGSGFQAINPQAAVYWNPANTVMGNYSLKGNFTLLKPSNHNNYYGLVFGGGDLDGEKQSYMYFMVSQNGSWLLKQKSGPPEASTVANGKNAAIKTPDASGRSTNAIEVKVSGDKIEYVVNGTTVHSTPKAGVKTDGTWGFRVNHFLEVQVDGLATGKL